MATAYEKRQLEAKKQKEAMDWISEVLGEKFSKPMEDELKDGIVLCKLMNKMSPGSVKKIEKKGGGGFVMMQNIERFQEAAKKYGVPPEEVFQTVALWEKKNIPQVCLCIFSLGRVAQTKADWDGPILGPKMSEPENMGDFSEEQLGAMYG